MKIILLGPPGAGKGTQSKVLAKRLNLPHISTGDLLRQNVAGGTELGKEAKDFMNKGMLVPDDLVTKMLVDRFQKPDLKNGFILDGYPRNLKQAEVLDGIFNAKKELIDIVIYLDTSESVVIQRLSGRLVCKSCGGNFHVKNMPPKVSGVCDSCKGELYQREDDKEATIRNRLEVYKKEVSCLLDYYKESNRLHAVLADEDAPVVLEKIIQLIKAGNDTSKVG